MNSRTSERFWKCYSELPTAIKKQEGYRAIGIIQGEDIVWFWIGNHSEYDKILKQLRYT